MKLLDYIVLILIFSTISCGRPSFDRQFHLVTKIIDGNTIEVDSRVKIHLIGVVDTRDAFNYLTSNYIRRRVRVQFDRSKRENPRTRNPEIYAYVITRDKISVNADILKQNLCDLSTLHLIDSLDVFSIYARQNKYNANTINPSNKSNHNYGEFQKAPNIKPNGKSKLELLPSPLNPFSLIDKHVRNCPYSIKHDIKLLANYFQIVAQSDLEKARAIYVWITENISYDDDAYNSKVYGDYSSEAVLFSKKAVCSGFSNVFSSLGKQMNLKIKKVSGYSKGYSYSIGERFTNTNHAWNIIKINGNWRIFDATWGQGNGRNVNGILISEKKFDDYWFNVDPYEAIFSHLPQDKSFAKVIPDLSLSEYEEFPKIDKGYFKLGFDAKETYQNILIKRKIVFPKCYTLGTYVKMIDAPADGLLSVNEMYKFEFYIPRGLSVAIIDADDNWSYFYYHSGFFSLEYSTSIIGELSIYVKYDDSGNSFQALMKYLVIKGGDIS